MDDKTMLEMAARAAHGEFGAQMLDSGWNPLTDDGDALRLAVKLGLDLLRTDQDVEAIAGLPPYVKADQPHAAAPFGIMPLGGDPYAATRRAIVRAAAEIGKGMGVE